jgi:hypothetical protein
MSDVCESREARYVPWSFGECFECLSCGHRALQHHNTQPLSGEGYDAVYPFPGHDKKLDHVRRGQDE